MSSVLQAIKVSGAVGASMLGTTGLMYTAPTTGYAIVQFQHPSDTSSGDIQLNIGGFVAYENTGVAGPVTVQLYVGPGAAVVLVTNTSAKSCYLTGVEFINTA